MLFSMISKLGTFKESGKWTRLELAEPFYSTAKEKGTSLKWHRFRHISRTFIPFKVRVLLLGFQLKQKQK